MSLGNDYILGQRKNAYTYNVTTAAVNKPLTINEVKNHLRIDDCDRDEDTYLNLLIDMASEFGEKYTGRDFINKSYTTFRNSFIEPLELRKSKVSSITSIEYLVSDVFTTLATTVYALQDVNDYPYVYLQTDQVWPTNADCLPQAVKIIFVSGYGASSTSVPAALKMAMLNHIAYVYSNRGDCGGDCSSANLPANSKALYDKYRIINLGSYENSPYHYRF